MSETRENGKPWWPEELITREQAIASLTLNVARQMLDKQEETQIRPTGDATPAGRL